MRWDQRFPVFTDSSRLCVLFSVLAAIPAVPAILLAHGKRRSIGLFTAYFCAVASLYVLVAGCSFYHTHSGWIQTRMADSRAYRIFESDSIHFFKGTDLLDAP